RSGEFRAREFVILLLRLLVLGSSGKRNGAGMRIGIGAVSLDVGHAAEDVVQVERFAFVTPGCHQLRLHVIHGDWLVTVVGDDQKHRQYSLVAEVGDKNVSLGRAVVHIHRGGNVLGGVRVLASIGACVAGLGSNEVLGAPKRRGGQHDGKGGKAKEDAMWRAHSGIIRYRQAGLNWTPVWMIVLAQLQSQRVLDR